MRLVLQRVVRAEVRVGGEKVSAIGPGLLALVGVARGDGTEQVDAAAEKLRHLRLFDDAEGKMNLDLAQAGGEMLLVSQFTLLAATDRGRRPSFEPAARPDEAAPLIARLAERLRAAGIPVATGRFGARMEVDLVNEGPVTLVLDFPSADRGR